MNNFKYNANMNISSSHNYNIDFKENSVVTQIVNLQPMIVSWVNDDGVENKIMVNIDFYNEKIYNFFGSEMTESLLDESLKEIIKTKKRNILNCPSPEEFVEKSSKIAHQAFKSEPITCQND